MKIGRRDIEDLNLFFNSGILLRFQEEPIKTKAKHFYGDFKLHTH